MGFRFQKRTTTLRAFVCEEQQLLFLDALITQRSVCENVTRCRGVFNLILVLKPLSLYSLKLKRQTALLHGFDPLVFEMHLCNKRFPGSKQARESTLVRVRWISWEGSKISLVFQPVMLLTSYV